MAYREAELADLDALVDLSLRVAAGSAAQAGVRADAAHVRSFVELALRNPHGIGVVAEDEGGVVGLCAFSIYPHMLSGELIAGQLCWWVDPEHRGALRGIRHLEATTAVCEAKGATLMQIQSADSQIHRVLVGLGYQKADTIYERVLCQESAQESPSS